METIEAHKYLQLLAESLREARNLDGTITIPAEMVQEIADSLDKIASGMQRSVILS